MPSHIYGYVITFCDLNKKFKMAVQTVLGKVTVEDLGVVLPHEHILVDFTRGLVPHPTLHDGRQIEGLSVTIENLGLIRRFKYSVRENVVLDEMEKAEQEVGLYKLSGGGSICEMSVVGMRRANHSFDDLATISKATGVHIVSTTGYYSETFLSPEVKAMSVRSMADLLTEEIMRGSGPSGVKCGVMYIACTDPLQETEKKALEAAAITNKETGVSVQIAPGRSTTLPSKILDILFSHGVPGKAISMSHMDRAFSDSEADIKAMSELCHKGCFINHSLFGKECSHYQCNKDFDFPNDAQRVWRIKALIERGCLDRLLVSHDVVCRNEWTCYGGYGYGHLLQHMVPKFLNRGMKQETVDTIMKKNPQNWLIASAKST